MHMILKSNKKRKHGKIEGVNCLLYVFMNASTKVEDRLNACRTEFAIGCKDAVGTYFHRHNAEQTERIKDAP